MPSGPRIRANNVFGTTTDNPLTLGATSFNSASLFLLPTVSSAHAIIVLDPKRVNGEPEIVIVTVHTALATSATIARGAYGTTPRAHPVGTAWAHVAVTDDMIPIVTSGTRPSDPFEGQYIYETDTHRPVHRDNTQWLPGGPVSVVTSGTRPANPYEGQTIYETDTHRPTHRDNTQWLPGGPISVVTSGTRPANPYEGQYIYETDTDFELVWNGSVWAPPRNRAVGWVSGDIAGINSNSAMALSKGTAEQVFLIAPAIATFANRRYKIRAKINTSSGGSWNYADLRIRRGTTTGGTQIARTFNPRPQAAGFADLEITAYDIPGAQASQQWCFTHALDTSVTDLFNPAWITVEDIGAMP